MTTSTYWRVANNDLPVSVQTETHCLQQQLPDTLGIGYSNSFKLDNDLSYIVTDYTPQKDLAILSHIESSEPRMVITLGLQGCSGFVGQSGEQLHFTQGYTTIATFNHSVGERQYQAQQTIQQLRLSLSKNWLDNYLGEQQTARLFNQPQLKLIAHRPISVQGRKAAQQLLNAQTIPELRKIVSHASALNLIAAELESLYSESNHITERDKRMAFLAYDILQQEFQNPPDIAELAKRVGTNQCKLKKLFQHFFNNTPYGILLDIRMNKAYQLLASKRYQVSAVAELIGYHHPNNFSVAFTKFFGIAPKVIAKQ